MSEELAADAHTRAVEQAKASAAYVQAEQKLKRASARYDAALDATVPQGLGPMRAERAAAEIAQRVRLAKVERDGAQKPSQCADAVSEPRRSAVVRGVGIEVVKLVGFWAFGFGSGWRSAPAAKLTSESARAMAQKRWGMRAA